MKSGPTGIGKHIQHIIFGTSTGITHPIGTGGFPMVLPFSLNGSELIFHNAIILPALQSLYGLMKVRLPYCFPLTSGWVEKTNIFLTGTGVNYSIPQHFSGGSKCTSFVHKMYICSLIKPPVWG